MLLDQNRPQLVDQHFAGRPFSSASRRRAERSDFHRIGHYGLFASPNRPETMEAVRKLLDLAPSAAEQTSGTDLGQPLAHYCPHCGGRVVIIETLYRPD